MVRLYDSISCGLYFHSTSIKCLHRFPKIELAPCTNTLRWRVIVNLKRNKTRSLTAEGSMRREFLSITTY